MVDATRRATIFQDARFRASEFALKKIFPDMTGSF